MGHNQIGKLQIVRAAWWACCGALPSFMCSFHRVKFKKGQAFYAETPPGSSIPGVLWSSSRSGPARRVTVLASSRPCHGITPSNDGKKSIRNHGVWRLEPILKFKCTWKNMFFFHQKIGVSPCFSLFFSRTFGG